MHRLSGGCELEPPHAPHPTPTSPLADEALWLVPPSFTATVRDFRWRSTGHSVPGTSAMHIAALAPKGSVPCVINPWFLFPCLLVELSSLFFIARLCGGLVTVVSGSWRENFHGTVRCRQRESGAQLAVLLCPMHSTFPWSPRLPTLPPLPSSPIQSPPHPPPHSAGGHTGMQVSSRNRQWSPVVIAFLVASRGSIFLEKKA